MRFIFEHPWPVAVALAAAAIILGWSGLREGLSRRLYAGGIAAALAAAALALGLAIDTPSEHARRVTSRFIASAVAGDIPSATRELAPSAVILDDWEGRSSTDRDEIQSRLQHLHRQYEIGANTVMRLEPMERPQDVLVELSLLTRVGGIGTVPSRWRLTIAEDAGGEWKIFIIDAIEVAGRSFR
ncbi:MAG: hypothetical protein QGH76_04810 [Phycisphaerales bacterium]|nr:hypothetical protein [Phycisphaerales bacterium]